VGTTERPLNPLQEWNPSPSPSRDLVNLLTEPHRLQYGSEGIQSRSSGKGLEPKLQIIITEKSNIRDICLTTQHVRDVCLFLWASAASHGCTAACWLIVPPTLDVPTLTTRCPRAYRRVPHSRGGRWNLWAENKDQEFCLSADFHGTFRDLLHAANL
jgi:hypothetical protein